MKAIFKMILIAIGLTAPHCIAMAQQATAEEKETPGTISPYQISVTYNKTAHLIFPSAIRYVDLGSDCIIAGKAEHAENVLRVKATARDFEEETNFSVITEDGKFYQFDVTYSAYPGSLAYDLSTMGNVRSKMISGNVFLAELGNNPPNLVGLIMDHIYRKNKRNIRHIGAKSHGVRFLLKGIYVHNDKYYFHTELRNSSTVPFAVEFITFKIVDKKLAKRTVIQEQTMQPIRTYMPLKPVDSSKAEQNVFLLDQFTISDDKILHIEIFEKNGGRQQVLQIENSDLVNAKVISDMQLKIK